MSFDVLETTGYSTTAWNRLKLRNIFWVYTQASLANSRIIKNQPIKDHLQYRKQGFKWSITDESLVEESAVNGLL